MIRRILAGVLLLCLIVFSADAQPTVLTGPTAINPVDSTVIENATLLLREGRIAAVGPTDEVTLPEEATVYELPGKYVIPGLIDGHVHFFQSGGLYTRPDILDLRERRPYEQERTRIKNRLSDTFRRYLRCGVTSVVDVGGPMWNLDVRARADTTAQAPSVVTAGPLISSVSRPSLDAGDSPILQISSPKKVRAEVRKQVEAGVDLVKIWYIVAGTDTPATYRPVVEAAIDEAHKADTRVAVHATELETARAAVKAGADILVHSVFDRQVGDEFVKLLVENDVLYIPTLMVRERYNETFVQQLDLTLAEQRIGQKEVIGSLTDLRTLPDSLLPPRIQRRIDRGPDVASDTTAMRNLNRLHAGGVSIAAGTDAGNIGTPHGPALFREFQLMRAAGLTPREILTAATAGGARLMGRASEVGQLRPGYQADLVVLDENPLTDVMHTTALHRIVKEGRVYAPRDLVPRTPEEVVLQGRNAYNTQDVDAFVDVFAEDVTVSDHPSTQVLEGEESLATQFRSLVEESTTLHAQFRYYTTIGNKVVAHETIEGLPDRDRPLSQVVLYRVINGLIDRAWLVQE